MEDLEEYNSEGIGYDWPEFMNRLENDSVFKFVFNRHESFMSLEERANLSEQSLEDQAFNIIRFNHLVKLRMDVALERRVKGKTNNYFAFTLEDAKMLEGCVEYYQNIMRNVDLFRDEKFMKIVKRNMIDVYGMLGKFYYYLWEDTESIIAFQCCKKLLDEIIEKETQINPSHQEWLFECLISKIVGELNSSNPVSETLINTINDYVETFGDSATKDYVNMSDSDFVKTISQQTNCDMQTIKQFLQFTKIKYFKSILNDEALVSSISNGIDFIKLQTNHPLSVSQLEFHFDMDEFYSRVGAILTNMNNSNASTYYNNSLSIRKNFFLRTLMNRIIDYQNSGLDRGDEKTLLFAMYYYLVSVLETFNFCPLPSIIISKDPFIYIHHLGEGLSKMIETNFPQIDLSSSIKESAEKLDQSKLLLYKDRCLKLLIEIYSNDNSLQEDLVTIQMLEFKNEEEKYKSLQILPLPICNDLCDIFIVFHE